MTTYRVIDYCSKFTCTFLYTTPWQAPVDVPPAHTRKRKLHTQTPQKTKTKHDKIGAYFMLTRGFNEKLEAVHGGHIDALHVVFEGFDDVRDIFDANLVCIDANEIHARYGRKNEKTPEKPRRESRAVPDQKGW